MPVASVALKKVALPEFGEPTVMPVVPLRDLRGAHRGAAGTRRRHGFDAFVVYGDREHAANIAYLTGYDPRFEEALLVIVPGRKPKLLVGNEGWGYAELCAGPYERDPLPDLLAAGSAARPLARAERYPCRMRPEGRPEDRRHRLEAVRTRATTASDETALDLPSFIADTLRSIAGEPRQRDQRRRPDDGPGRRPARRQRGRPARRLRVRGDLHLARPAQRAREDRARHDRTCKLRG